MLAAGLGVSQVLRYRPALRDEASARRIAVEERDERSVQIRTRAGNRAWIVSAVWVWIALMWVSFASNGDVPPLAGDLLWWYLVAAFLRAVRRLRRQHHDRRAALLTARHWSVTDRS